MDLNDKYLSILKSNQRAVGDFRYTVPSSSVYPHQWLWDSCFHAVIYSRFKEFDYAKDEIRALLAGQWKNGMIPHMIYWQKTGKHKIDWGTNKNTSSITQPPMVAYAVERIFEATNDRQFLEEVFDKLDKYYKWLHQERSDDYILSIIHPWESGEDNLIAWDVVCDKDMPSDNDLRKSKLHILNEYIKSGLSQRKFMRKNIFNVKSLLFNSVYLRNLHSLMRLGRVINSAKTKYYEELIPKVKKSFRKNMYSKASGLYSSYYNKKEFIPSITSDIFLPLFAGVLTKPQSQRIIKEYLLNENMFWVDYPIPTISARDLNFQPGRYWRGSTWININWFVYKGLTDYGFDGVAKKLKERTLAMIEQSGFCEYYNPISGDGYGPKDFCWSGLIFDM